ncbi:acetyltransferase (GNAT) family protein [Prauserella shujinwangii]|uniref:Acetyltransferase (GNAT) family protein n=1 Tax=Prauserella shujinwangii TaxID=1453103 RepID=A0A2T0LLH5_9PSEU|nr:GNAT family N-acetyltransferase [Prauserella shujinwangii]PRX43895.1 acetyltransferase (GNAT) family protein [Prauserella shujinwangii]
MDTEHIANITAEHAKRLLAEDSLIPPPTSWAGAGGTLLGTEHAVALATRSEISPTAAEALWRPLVEHRLDVRLAGSDPGARLGELLDAWEPHVRECPRGEWDTAAIVVRPSRDTAGTEELIRRGFAPGRVIAVRPADRLGGGPPAVPGVRIRRAEWRDRPTAVRLLLELLRYDAQFGLVTPRDAAERVVTEQVDRELAQREPQLWIAELYGEPLGIAQLQLPPASDWVRGQVSAGRVGYLTSLNVAEQARSTGVGTALAEHAHQVFDEAGAEVVLLHHALASPRSTPFWYAQGYRPLWTYWYRRPAVR